MRTARLFAAAVFVFPFLTSCCCMGDRSEASSVHQRQQMKANNLQTLNAGRSATLPGD